MQDYPLTLPHIFHRAERLFADKELVTATATGRDRTTYGEWAARARTCGARRPPRIAPPAKPANDNPLQTSPWEAPPSAAKPTSATASQSRPVTRLG